MPCSRGGAYIFEQAAWPAELKRERLDPYYDLAEEMLGSKPLSPPAGLDLPARTRAFLRAANTAGRKAELVPIGVYAGPAQPNQHGNILQEPCDYSDFQVEVIAEKEPAEVA